LQHRQVVGGRQVPVNDGLGRDLADG
jgi:hypothetical protein